MSRLSLMIVALVPITILFVVLMSLQHHDADWGFHFSNEGQYPYPELTKELLSIIELVVERKIAMFLLAIASFIWIPFILIHKITNNLMPAILYIYGTGIPFLLFDGWFIPQGLFNILLLLCMLNTNIFFIAILIGQFVHNKWFFGLLLALGYKYLRDSYGNKLINII